MKNLFWLIAGIIIGSLSIFFFLKSSEKQVVQSEGTAIENMVDKVDIMQSSDTKESVGRNDQSASQKTHGFQDEINLKDKQIAELTAKLESQKRDYEKRLRGVSFLSDSVPIGNSTSEIWNKMDQIADPAYKPEKNDWSYQAEQFMQGYLAQNTFIYHTDTNVFCDIEACLVTALEFDVGENFRNSDGDKEWTAFWQKTDNDSSLREYFQKEKMGGSNPGEKERTREKRMIFMREY